MRREFAWLKGMRRSFVSLVFVCGYLLTFVVGCAKQGEVVVRTAEEQRATPEQMNADPWALLPGGAVGWLKLEVAPLLNAEYGPDALLLLEKHLPLAKGAGVNIQEDISELLGAGYATVGADWVLIARGKFDAEKIRTATRENPRAVSGEEILARSYAGESVYVAKQVAMSVLSNQLLVFGSETGVRRVLERVEEGRLARTTPKWFEELWSQKGAEWVLGIDMDSNPIPGVLKSDVVFTEGLRAARLVGNFQAPGFNLAGAMSYEKPAHAKRAADYLHEQNAQLSRYKLILRMMNIPMPIVDLQAAPTDKNLQAALVLDGHALSIVLSKFESLVDQFLTEALQE